MAKKEAIEEVAASGAATPLAAAAGAPSPMIGGCEYALLKTDAKHMLAVIKANMGDGGLSAFDLTRIKMPAGGGTVWQVPSLKGVKNIETIEGVVIHWQDVRAYWARAFSGEGTPPDCSSDTCAMGQGDPGGECAHCPFAAFGTATNAKGEPARGQACKQVRRLFILTPGSLLPVLIAVPPGSLKKLVEYFRLLAGSGLFYWQVSTRLTLSATKNADGITYSQITVAPGAPLDPDQAAIVQKVAEAIAPTLADIVIDSNDYPQEA